MASKWAKDEDRALLDGVGVFSVDWFVRKTGRTPRGVYNRVRRVLGEGGLSRGSYSLKQASQETGYTRRQLLRAQSALNQKWKRLSPKGSYLITFEQLEEMTDWLRQDYWSPKLRLYGCVNCGNDSRPPKGRGQCPRCYFKIRRLMIANRLPLGMRDLRRHLEGLDTADPQMRGFLERMVRQLRMGWGPTEPQIRALLSLSPLPGSG